ncbi:NAD(P)-dependent oxidoreductase [Streptomyces sp. G45]|uniref:NAD(P)-dependent oxidoreductase n=1 Tax=Streptomyces sp. G45 TaxID=3406627 RepID=UPI003C2163C9
MTTDNTAVSAASTTPAPSPVTVIGLGPMGLVLAETLLAKGHPTTVWNRTPAKADALVARGAVRAATVAEAVAASPVTVLCLKDYAALYEVCEGAGAALAGRALVNLNSGTPKEAHAAVAWAAERGAAYLDGAIMVPPPLVGRPDAVFLYSGAREVFDEHRALLASLGDPRYLGADAGLAVLYNTALLAMMYATMNGYLQATALVGSAGVTAVDFSELALGWFAPAVLGPMLPTYAPQLDAGAYPGDLGTLEMNVNALEHILRTSEEQGVATEQARLAHEIAVRAVTAGHGQDNYMSVFEVVKHRTA